MAQTAIFDILGPIAQKCRECPIPTLTEAVLNAARQLCRQSHWLDANIASTLVVGEPTYNLGTDVYNEVIGVRAMSVVVTAGSDVRPLERRSTTLWDPACDADTPEFFDYLDSGDITLHPTPDLAYEATLTLILQPKLGALTIDSTLVRTWEEALRAGALAYLQDIPGQPWSDPRSAGANRDVFLSWINRASSAVARRYKAGMTLIG